MLAATFSIGGFAVRNEFKVWPKGIANRTLTDRVLHNGTNDRPNDQFFNYALLLRLHGDTRALSMGMVTHHQLIRSNFEKDSFLGNLVLQMYGKCGALQEARFMLTQMYQRDVFAWTFTISAYAHAGQASSAVQLYYQMQHAAVVPSSFTLVEILCACGKGNLLVEGQHLHASIVANSSASGVCVENALLNCYGKCCHLKAAQKVFSRMEERDVVSYNTMLTAYIQHGEHNATRQLFQAMLQQGFVPNKVTYTCLCEACISKEDLSESRRFHLYIMGCRLDGDVDLGNTIICMYARCGNLNDACLVFYEMCEPNVVSWTTLIAAFAQQKLCKEALTLSQQMLLEAVLPNNVTFLNLISACSNQENLTSGIRIHAQVVSISHELNILIGNALINLYGKCKKLKMARMVFDDMTIRDEVSWNSLIAACSLHELSEEVLELFGEMQLGRVTLDRVTSVSVLQSIANEQDLEEGKLVHAHICQSWDNLDGVIGSALVNMYAKCGSLEDAQSVFDKVSDHTLVLWTALISAYGQHGQSFQANQVFEHMKSEGFIPDELAFSTVLFSCSGLAPGKWVHACILGCRRISLEPVVNNALLSMYSSCGSLSDAENAFKKLVTKNVVTWNIMINACTHGGQPRRAFHFFKQMRVDGVLPNMSIYASLLNACATLAVLAEGMQIHELLLIGGIEPDVVLGTALVNFYGKCGRVEDAQCTFARMPKRNVAAWNSIIASYCQIGDMNTACTFFRQMPNHGVRPDGITFLTLVSSYSHAGLVDEALDYFLSMTRDYCLTPTVEHYNCLIDLFGRAGCLDKVEDMLAQVSFEPDLHSQMSLLNACRVHEDVDRGERIVKSLSKLQTSNHAPQVLMSNIYAAAGRFEAAALVRIRVGGD